MGKQKKTSERRDLHLAIRRMEREQRVAALREGRVQRAATLPDRRKVAARRACRGRHGLDG